MKAYLIELRYAADGAVVSVVWGLSRFAGAYVRLGVVLIRKYKHAATWCCRERTEALISRGVVLAHIMQHKRAEVDILKSRGIK